MSDLNRWQPESWRIGCCGFAVGKNQYFSLFKAVEIQQTFYQPPEDSTLHRWRAEAPPDFIFTIKSWQLITHDPSSPTYKRLRRLPEQGRLEDCGSFRCTPTVLAAWERSLQCAHILDAEAIVIQCPASFRPTPQNVSRFRQFMEQAVETMLRLRWARVPRIVWEPRGDWDPSLISRLCEEFDLIHGVDPFIAEPVTPPPVYLRLHGMPGYSHQYTDEELNLLSDKLHTWKTGWCFFNNRTMLQDALRLLRIMGEGTDHA